MDEHALLKIIAKERYELELMSIELKRMISLVHWNKKYPDSDFLRKINNEKTLKIQVDIQELQMELKRVNLDNLNNKLHILTINNQSPTTI